MIRAARMNRALAMVGAAALPVWWLVVLGFGLVDAPAAEVLWSGLAIFGAAFLLSWGCEVAQLDIPQALAIAVLALIAVLPEYAVDAYFAWQAGQDPQYTAYATANMTGANRLLIGVGWSLPVVVAWARFGSTSIRLAPDQAIEVRYLAIATLYSFVIPVKGTLSLIDTLVLFTLFAAYIRRASRVQHVEPELDGPAESIAALGPTRRRAVVVLLAMLAGGAILTAAEPFAEGLIAIGDQWGIEKFLLVQWLAPLASESPEFIIAILFAVRGLAATGISTLVSSKVNQWTLLVGALPLVFSISSAGLDPMVLDTRQRQEIFLTSAQSLFGVTVLANFTFGLREALVLFTLFSAQLVTTSGEARLWFAYGYVALAIGNVLRNADTRRSIIALLRPSGSVS